MICISIAQSSRRLVLADMMNAAPQCDLLEVRLDKFINTPDIGALIENKPRPIILSCRRKSEMGDWAGTEEDRQALLRQAIVSKADFVELEMDIASSIPRFPPAKRVISYVNPQETPENINEIYEEALTKDPDVVKLTTLIRTIEEAWPLLKIINKAKVPTVVEGLGKPGVMLSVLGKKLVAGWAYAALEPGMRVYPGQPTAMELRDVYHYGDITSRTRLIGVTGFGESATYQVALLNAALKHLELPARCLPIQVGTSDWLGKVMKASKMPGVILDDRHCGLGRDVCSEFEKSSERSGVADVVVQKSETRWKGYNSLWRGAVTALEETIQQFDDREQPLDGRVVMVAGATPDARSIIYGVQRRGAMAVIASRNADDAKEIAREFECRQVQFEAMYSTMHDVLVITSEEREKMRSTNPEDVGIHPSYLREGMVVMDMTSPLAPSDFLQEAAVRGCHVVAPQTVLRAQAEVQLRFITGKEIEPGVLGETLTNLLNDQ